MNTYATMHRFHAVMSEFLGTQQQLMSALLDHGRIALPRATTIVPELPAAGVPRYALRAHPAPLPEAAGLAPGAILVTDAGSRIGERLVRLLASRGRDAVLLTPVGDSSSGHRSIDFSSANDVERALAEIRASHGSIAALVHVLPVGRELPAQLDRVAAARALADARALFLILKGVRNDLEQAARHGGSALIGVSRLGGAFASDPAMRPAAFFPGDGAVTGMLKAFAVESPAIRVRAVDVDQLEDDGRVAEQLASELEAADDLNEVGYAAGRRICLRPVSRRVATDASMQPSSDWVWLVTGGARGITAEICLELARRTQPTVILVGQASAPSGVEDDATAGIEEPQELKALLLRSLKSGSSVVTPAMVEDAYRRLQRDREIRANFAVLSATGARVHYASLDVRNEAAFESLVHDIYATHGRLDGVIHGAGIIEDKLIKDKAVDSFERVFGTKVTSAFVLARTLRLQSLRALVFFSSVAGRFGNRGQGDYGAANEVLNKLAVHLSGRSSARVVALNWGPWDKRGMVSADVKRGFAERGVELLSPADGRAAFFDELSATPSEVEVVVGGGPWNDTAIAEPARVPLPLMAHGVTRAPHGEVDVVRSLDPAVDRYLDDHCLDGKPVLPLAAAVEFIVEAAQQAYPELVVVAIENCRLLRGVVLEHGPCQLRISAEGPARQGDRGRIEVDVALSVDDPASIRYRATVVLAAAPQPACAYGAPSGDARPFPLTASECYRRWLFHGPRFQRITMLDSYEWGIRAELSITHANACIAGIERPGWIVDPLTLDVAPQLGLIWSRAQDDANALPIGFERYELFDTVESDPAACVFFVREGGAGAGIVADAYFVTRNGEVAGLLTHLQCMPARALNRLSGTAVTASLEAVAR